MPCNAAMDARWLPDGPERIWVEMARSWCLTALLTLNTLLVPRVAMKLGWQANFRVYG